MSPHIHIARVGSVQVIRLDRPPVNALDLPTLTALCEAVEAVATSGAGALLLVGRDGAFSAGIDLKAVFGYDDETRAQMIRLVDRLALALYDATVPTVAAITGHAVGGGMIMLLACDMRLAADRPANLSLPEVRAGIAFPEGAMAVVKNELSPALIRRMVLADQRLTPEEAVAAGVLDGLRPRETLEADALAEAERLAGLTPDVFLATRRQLRREALAVMRAGAAQPQSP